MKILCGTTPYSRTMSITKIQGIQITCLKIRVTIHIRVLTITSRDLAKLIKIMEEIPSLLIILS
jgi:hypothetical protein